jgi:hypothetical protein
MSYQETEANIYKAVITVLLIAILVIVTIVIGNNSSPASNTASESQIEANKAHTSTQTDTFTPVSPTPPPASTRKGSCKDVTSYDYNWDNDMLCTRPDGTTFYTDYAGARAYEQQ